MRLNQRCQHPRRRVVTRRRALAVLFCAALWLGLCAGTWADGSAGSAAPYLREGLGARALAMGNAGTSTSQDASAAYWNPAALAHLPADSLASQTAVLGWERSWNYLAYAHPGQTEQGGRFAYAATWIHFSAGGDLEGRVDNRPEAAYTFGDSQNAFLLSLATGLGSQVAVGSNLKLLLHDLDDASASGFGLDLGVWHKPLPELRWGLMFHDLYSSLNWNTGYQDRLPTLARGGVTYAFLDETLIAALEGGLSYSHGAGALRDYRYHLGVEYRLNQVLALRSGLDTGRWSVGAGGRFLLGGVGYLRLDYALAGERFPGEGLSHLFSLVLDLLPGETGSQ